LFLDIFRYDAKKLKQLTEDILQMSNIVFNVTSKRLDRINN